MQPVTNLVGVMVIRPLLLMTTALILTAAPHALQAQDLSPDERARQVEARMMTSRGNYTVVVAKSGDAPVQESQRR